MSNEAIRRIPFHVEINRVIELLAKQIYQTPLALLRENCQNAFDAILMRIYSGQKFEPKIEVTISQNEIIVQDNGIGMSAGDLESHFWRAGSSGKNTPEAKAAGVVGTFGIGAMANFGVASEIIVMTESSISAERTKSIATRDTLSASENCIDMISEALTGSPGTTIIAKVQPNIQVNIQDATNYVANIVRHLNIPVFVNGSIVSQVPIESSVQQPDRAWTYNESSAKIGNSVNCNIEVISSANGEIWVSVSNLIFMGAPLTGILVLRQGLHQIRTFRSSFALAAATASSQYGFGGVANLMNLEPTAGREALTTNSLQVLQTIVTEVENFVSEKFATTDLCDKNTLFMQWTLAHNRIDLCGKLRSRMEPGNKTIILEELRRRSNESPMNFYDGSDQTIIQQFASDDKPLLVLATQNPRKNCEVTYLQRFCKMTKIANNPTVLKLKAKSDWSLDENSFAFRIAAILSTDYFVESNVSYGKVSHNLPMLVDITKRPIEIVLDSTASTLAAMLQLYKTDYDALSSLAKDFVRNAIFPIISTLVPSSNRQGAEAFLRAVRRPKDILEYEYSDLGSFSSIWQDYLDGKIPLSVATEKSVSLTQKNMQVIDNDTKKTAEQVIPDVLQNAEVMRAAETSVDDNLQPLPAITRLNIESNAKLLTIDEGSPLKGYRCFIAVTDRVKDERGDFFLQPHYTEIVWGGQKAMYIFQHHSREFAIYYELQAQELLAPSPGGQLYPTCTIVIKNQIYIPVPEELRLKFLPDENSKKRFEIRCELLYPDSDK